MTQITNAEQVLLLLRSHLQRTQRARKKDMKARPAATGEVREGALERVHHIAVADGFSEADVSRALISGLLAEEFGSAVANDQKFQVIVDDVLQVIGRDEDARQLLKRAVDQLAAGK